MTDDKMTSLRRELAVWARQEPQLPAPVARGRVLERLGEGSRRDGWRHAAIATLAAAAVAFAVLVLAPRERGPEVLSVAPDRGTPAASLLVYQLRSGAKLYLALAADGGAQGLQGGQR